MRWDLDVAPGSNCWLFLEGTAVVHGSSPALLALHKMTKLVGSSLYKSGTKLETIRTNMYSKLRVPAILRKASLGISKT